VNFLLLKIKPYPELNTLRIVPPFAQILPFWIHLINKVSLPFAFVSLQLLFSLDCFFYFRKFFIVNKSVTLILCSKAIAVQFRFVFVHSLLKIACYSSVQNGEQFICEEVNKICFHNINITVRALVCQPIINLYVMDRRRHGRCAFRHLNESYY